MTEDERAIRELVDTWMAASKAGDISAVLDLMTDDVLFLTAGREPFGKAEFKANSEAMRDMKMDGRAAVQEIEVANGWAWIRNHLDISMTGADGATVQRSGPTLTVLRKCGDGHWRLFRDANLVR